MVFLSLRRGEVTFTTGNLGWSYLGLCSIKYPSCPGAPNYQADPSKTKPCTYAPFSAGACTSSADLKNVTLVWRDILSRGRVFSLEVFCIIAVRKLIGLNKKEIQSDFGVANSVDHCSSCAHL